MDRGIQAQQSMTLSAPEDERCISPLPFKRVLVSYCIFEGKRVGTRICRLSRRGGQAEHDLMLNRIDDVDGGDYY